MKHAVRGMIAVTLLAGLAACSTAGFTTQQISSDVRAVLNADGEVIAHQAFRSDTGRWYDARLIGGSGHVLTPRGVRNHRRDRRRENRD